MTRARHLPREGGVKALLTSVAEHRSGECARFVGTIELEYAGTLSEVIPSVHDELYLVANAKVESSYAELRPTVTDAGALRRAYARIRMALVRLSLRGK